MFQKIKNLQITFELKILFFFCFLFVAIFISSYIVLPYSNEYGVSGPLTILKFNPLNNIVRFLFIVFFPTLVYCVAFFVYSGRLIKNNGLACIDHKMETVVITDLVNESRKKFLLLLIFVLFLFFHLGFGTFNNKPLDTFHEGESLGTAIDYQSGKKPYRDTILLQGIFQNPVRSVMAFNLFGQSISSQRLVESILNIIVFLLFFVAVFSLFNFKIVYGVFVGIILFLFLDVSFVLPFRDITTYLFIIVTSLFYYKFIDKYDKNEFEIVERKKTFFLLVFLSFFIPTASFANSIDRGMYSFAGAIFFFLLTVILFYKNKKHLHLFVLSALSGFIAGLIIIIFATRGALLEFITFTFVRMPMFKGLLDEIVYDFSGRNLIPVILFSAVIFWITDSFMTRISSNNAHLFDKIRGFILDYYIELFLIFLSLVFFRSALGRSDIGHVLYVSAPLFITLAYILIKHNLGINKENSKSFYLLTLIVLLTIITNNLYKHNFSKGENWWNFSTNVKDEQLIPENYKKTITFLKDNLEEDEYFITLTSEASWYYFVNKPCPIKFPIVWFASPKFYQKETVAELKAKKEKIKYVIYKNNLWTNNADYIPNEKRLPILFKYIKQNYQFLINIDDQEIWEIKRK